MLLNQLGPNKFCLLCVPFSSVATLYLQISICLSVCPPYLGGNVIFSALIKIEVWFLFFFNFLFLIIFLTIS